MLKMMELIIARVVSGINNHWGMANIKLTVKGKKNPSPIYVRFYTGRSLDIQTSINILVNPDQWDNKNEQFKKRADIKDVVKKNSNFLKLKSFVIDAYSNDYMEGEIIDKDWLSITVSKYFNRPKHESNSRVKSHYVYFVEFAEYWLKDIAPTWKTDKHKYLSIRAVQQYETFVLAFKNYEKSKQGSRHKIKDIDNVVTNDFSTYLTEKAKYASATSKRLVGRLKFFLNRAEKMGIEIDPSFKEPVFVDKEESDILVPYLNENEIGRIFNLDLSNDYTLENIRDSFIIAVYSGLRISDFNNNLDVDNIDGDYINIKTTKTGQWVTIPLHKRVKHVLKKRMGNLPAKFSDKHFNEHIKTVCMLADIDEEIKGKLFDNSKKRKITGMYAKWKLISSHTGRRSFATNLHGVIPNHVIMDVAGWSSEKMLLRYVKRTKKESAIILKKKWDEEYN